MLWADLAGASTSVAIERSQQNDLIRKLVQACDVEFRISLGPRDSVADASSQITESVRRSSGA